VPAFIAFLAHEQAVGTLDVVFEEDPLLQLIKKKKTSIEKKYFIDIMFLLMIHIKYTKKVLNILEYTFWYYSIEFYTLV